ncbi:MAG: YdcF family protein [Clostridia bacterium]|nr:YdcF family protein [Clostridia bacterium]
MIKKAKIVLKVLLFLICIFFFVFLNKSDDIIQSLIIRLFFGFFTLKIICDFILFIRKKFQKHKYSYSIVLYLGLVLFLAINVSRHFFLFINNLYSTSISDIYINTLDSFEYFSYLVIPMILLLALYSIGTNIVLIKKEGFVFGNLLGIIFGVIILLGAAASQNIYLVTKNIELISSEVYIKRFIDISLNSALCYFYSVILATLYCNIRAAKYKPDYDKDFIIILGSQIRADGSLMPLLKARVDKAIEFAKEQKEKENRDIIFIPSGGQGPDEIVSEAESMKKYLIENGIDPKNIVIEDKSTSTIQNMKFSKEIIDELNKDGNVVFSTNDFHVFRSGVIASNEGLDCVGMGCKTKRYFYVNALIREFFANVISERKTHLLIITIMNLILLLLVFIGYRYNLI